MMMNENGIGVATPITPIRKSGRKIGPCLPKGALRALRDLCYIQLIDLHGLTPCDALEVLRNPVDPRQVRSRRKALQPLVDQHGVIGLMSAIAKGPIRAE